VLTGVGDSPDSTPDVSHEGTPAPDELRLVPVKQLQTLKSLSKKTKGSKRRTFWTFGIGGLVGVLVAGFFASNNSMMDFAALKDVNLDSMLDVLPAGLIRDAQALQVR